MMARTVPTLSSMSKLCRNSSFLCSTRISNWTTGYGFLVETTDNDTNMTRTVSLFTKQIVNFCPSLNPLSYSRRCRMVSPDPVGLYYHADPILGRTNRTSVKQVKYFFENQTFGPDFYRRGFPADVSVIAPVSNEIMIGHPIPYGANAPNGTYITDSPPQINFVSPTSLP